MGKQSQIDDALDWIQWNKNSCRYDSFISVFSLGLFNKFKEFNLLKSSKQHKYHKEYALLCEIAQFPLDSTSSLERKNLIGRFWTKMNEVGLDNNEKGKMRFVQELLLLFAPLLHLQPFFEEERICKLCDLKEKR